MAQTGVVSGNTLSITAAGIAEIGTLVADLLTGSAAGDAKLSGTPAKSNKVVQLASFTSGQTLTLDDGVGLTITGPLTAPSIVIDTGANPLTLADKATITTGGIDRPPGIIPSTDFPPDEADHQRCLLHDLVRLHPERHQHHTGHRRRPQRPAHQRHGQTPTSRSIPWPGCKARTPG